MKKLRKLSEVEFKHTYKYAGCYNCKEIFNRDLSNYGSIYCPNGCGWILINGKTYEELYKEINE